jgi:hypothetical protein
VLHREQALRADRQHHGHQHVDQHRRDGGAGRLRERALEELAQQRGQERTADRVDDADDQRTVEAPRICRCCR